MTEPRSAAIHYRTAAGALAAILLGLAGFLLGGMSADIQENRRALVASRIQAAKQKQRLEALENQLRIVRSIITERIELQHADRNP